MEIFLLCVAAGLLAKGLHMPPPVGTVTEVVGTVQNVDTTRGAAPRFSLNGGQFTTEGPQIDRGALRDGDTVRLVLWAGQGWPLDGYPQVLALYRKSHQREELLFQNGRSPIGWAMSGFCIFVGLLTAGLTLVGIRTLPPMAGAIRKRELADVVPSARSKGRERLTGAITIAGGIAIALAGIAVAANTNSKALNTLFGLGPFAGMYATIVGAHRLLFGRPLTVHDTRLRRVAFGLAVTAFLITAGLVWWGILIYMSLYAPP
jgi:hypothetical protein